MKVFLLFHFYFKLEFLKKNYVFHKEIRGLNFGFRQTNTVYLITGINKKLT